MGQDILHRFIVAINDHNLEELGALMTDDHAFIDAHNNRVEGREKMLAGWKSYFEWFPDYKIEAEKVFCDGNEFAVFGFAEGTYHNLNEDKKAHWRLPASWKVVVDGGQVALWQVYADAMIPFEIINRYAAPTGDADKVTGIGGVFFKSADPKGLCKWYDEHLGTGFSGNEYMAFTWRQHENKEHVGSTVFSAFKTTTDYFAPSAKEFMFNFRVNNLDAILERLKKEGVNVFEKVDSYDFGKFGWIMDLEGNKIELWEPMNE
jgi:predicted enzyme related to lactoylglutathione lyase/ketosteroid isomerase-like protein